MKRKLAALWLAAWFGPALLIPILRPDYGHRLERALRFPSLGHPFGFDAFGRDLWLMISSGALTSSAFAAVAVILAIVLGIALGGALAMAPERVEFAGERLLDLLLSFPTLLLALIWAAIRGPSWDTLIVTLSIGTVPTLARLAYVRSREVLAEEFVLAARSVGGAPAWILRKHLAPELLALCRIKAPNLFASALMTEATLSFIGVGAPRGSETWGSLLAQGRDYLLEAPHIAIATGIPLVLTLLALQALSGLNDRR